MTDRHWAVPVMAKKISRNAPCPCGSGKKYKLCCLPALEAADAKPARTTPPPSDDDLDVHSNRVVDLIHAGHLDEAEAAAHDLIRRFPHAMDGLERLGHVYEARGNPKQAALHYRQAIALIRRHFDTDDEHTLWLQDLADRLDPPPAT